MAKSVILDKQRDASADRRREVERKMNLDNIENAVKWSADRAWRAAKGSHIIAAKPGELNPATGKRYDVPDWDSAYVPCPWPKSDRHGTVEHDVDGDEIRCNYKPKGDGPEKQADAIIHWLDHHYRAWLKENTKIASDGTEMLPPNTIVAAPVWGEDGEDPYMNPMDRRLEAAKKRKHSTKVGGETMTAKEANEAYDEFLDENPPRVAPKKRGRPPKKKEDEL